MTFRMLSLVGIWNQLTKWSVGNLVGQGIEAVKNVFKQH